MGFVCTRSTSFFSWLACNCLVSHKLSYPKLNFQKQRKGICKIASNYDWSWWLERERVLQTRENYGEQRLAGAGTMAQKNQNWFVPEKFPLSISLIPQSPVFAVFYAWHLTWLVPIRLWNFSYFFRTRPPYWRACLLIAHCVCVRHHYQTLRGISQTNWH